MSIMLIVSHRSLIQCSLRVSPSLWSQCMRKSLHFKRSKSKHGFGYYIVFPDISNDTSLTNELMRLPINDSTTKFSQLNAEKCYKAVGKLSIQYESCIDDIEQQLDDKENSKTLDDVLLSIEKQLVPLEFAMGTMKMLSKYRRDKYGFIEFDELYDRVIGVRSRRFLSPQIYYFMREVNADRKKLDEHRKRIVDKYLLEAKLSGTYLPSQDRDKLNSLNNKIYEQKCLFRDNVTEATRRFKQTIDDPNLLRVLPDELISVIGSHNYATVTLDSSVFNQFMEYCPNRLLRWNLLHAYNSRASPLSDKKKSNGIHIEELRSFRKQKAKVLGFDNYVELSMETKMAASVKNVKSMIMTFHSKNKTPFDNCLKDLTDFALESGHEYDKLELWDLPYWKRKLLTSKYSLDDSAIRQYFPLDSVLNGIFQLSEKLFTIRIEEVTPEHFDPWHEDVKLFRILSERGIIASFFFDPFSRPNVKASGISIDMPLSRCDSLQTKPLIYFIMNLRRPLVKNQPILLSFSEILEMFKKFGYILQHSLTEMSFNEISGLTNIEWDSVNMCSEFFALWPLNNYKVLASCSSHVANKSQISEEEFNRIRKAHYHFAPFTLKSEIYKSALDLALYSNDEYWGSIMDQVWSEYMSPFTKEKDDVHPCSFRTIFCDDFPASYYSFKWAKMLGADAFSAFQEVGLDDDKAILNVGSRFRDTFLALGGGCRGSEVFRRFRGRDPSPDAFLEITGIQQRDKRDIDKELGSEKSSVSGKI